MTALVMRLGEVSLAAAAVLLPLLLLAGPIRRRYRAGSCALLWLLLSLWLLLPVRWSPVGEAAVVVPLPGAEEVLLPPLELRPAGPAAPAPPQEAAPAPGRSLSLGEAAAWTWLAGCAGLLLWQAVGSARLRQRLLTGAEEAPADQVLLARLWQGEHGRPQVLRSRRAGPPLSLGLLRPAVVLPWDLAEEEAELVLRHELAHIRRGHLWYKALLGLVNAVYWFHPLVWWMVRRAGRDLELCCDDAVVAGRDAAFRHRYGEVLLRWAARAPAGTACAAPLSGEAREMKGRIMNLFATKKKTGALLVGLCLCAAVLLGTLVTFDQAQAQEGEPLTAQEALDALGESVMVTDKEISFTIPADFKSADDWRIQVSGRYQMGEEGSMSIHLLDNDGTAGRWKGGDGAYSVPLADYDLDRFESLTLWAWLPGGDGEELELQVDILDSIAPAESGEEAQGEALQWPLPSYTELSMVFGTRVHPITGRTTTHDGVDIPAPEGTPVLAAAAGAVAEAGWDGSDGNYVLLSHAGGLTTRYCHLAQASVALGDQVAAGEAIGTVGATGMATGPHLHLEAAVDGALTDPAGLFPDMDLSFS